MRVSKAGMIVRNLLQVREFDSVMVGKTITLLTELEVKNAEIKESAYKLKAMPELHLQVNPSGSKISRLRYRNPKATNETMYTIGTFPQVKCAWQQKRPKHK